ATRSLLVLVFFVFVFIFFVITFGILEVFEFVQTFHPFHVQFLFHLGDFDDAADHAADPTGGRTSRAGALTAAQQAVQNPAPSSGSITTTNGARKVGYPPLHEDVGNGDRVETDFHLHTL